MSLLWKVSALDDNIGCLAALLSVLQWETTGNDAELVLVDEMIAAADAPTTTYTAYVDPNNQLAAALQSKLAGGVPQAAVDALEGELMMLTLRTGRVQARSARAKAALEEKKAVLLKEKAGIDAETAKVAAEIGSCRGERARFAAGLQIKCMWELTIEAGIAADKPAADACVARMYRRYTDAMERALEEQSRA